MIHFDNASTSFPKPPAVVDAVAAWLRDGGVSPGRGVYRTSRLAADQIEEARGEVARFIGAPDATRVAFTASATDALNGAIAGVLSQREGAVVTTAFEHNSVMRPLRASGRELRVLATDDALRAVVDEALLEGAALAVITHASNVTGVAQDAAGLAAACREHGVPILVDASQSVGVLDLDVAAFDLVAFAGHKNLYGPPGIGALYVGIDLPPWRVGGSGGFQSDLDAQPRELPWRYEAGTPNGAAIAGLLAGLRHVRQRTSAHRTSTSETGLPRVRQHLFNLTRRLLAQLVILDNVDVLTPAPDVGIVSFNVRGWDPREVARVLDESFEIAVGAGLSCAPDAHRFLQTMPAGAVRVSAGLFNTETDVDALADAIARMADMEIYSGGPQ